MARTLPPIQAIRAEIDALFTEGRDLVEVIEDVARLGARLIIQTAVGAEVDAFPGRARYQRAPAVAADAGDTQQGTVRPGYRNGHRPATVKTTSGPITIARPKLRGTTGTFASRLFGTGVTRTHALETLVTASFVRGMSVRDVERALADAPGPEAALSKPTVSTICQAIVTEYDAWCRRELTGVELDYLFLDASHFTMHDSSSRAEPILAAWGITTAGKPVFPRPGRRGGRVHRRLARLLVRPDKPRPQTTAAGRLRRCARPDQRRRAGLRALTAPKVPGASRPQRAVQGQHRRPGRGQGRLPADLRPHRAGREHPARPAPGGLGATTHRRLRHRLERPVSGGDQVPAARPPEPDHLPTLPSPAPQARPASNFIERTFGETRRRVKVIGRFPGETSCVSLVWAVLDRASRG